jgi:hypothetical protein
MGGFGYRMPSWMKLESRPCYRNRAGCLWRFTNSSKCLIPCRPTPPTPIIMEHHRKINPRHRYYENQHRISEDYLRYLHERAPRELSTVSRLACMPFLGRAHVKRAHDPFYAPRYPKWQSKMARFCLRPRILLRRFRRPHWRTSSANELMPNLPKMAMTCSYEQPGRCLKVPPILTRPTT